MSESLTEMVRGWADNPYITHDDVTKCGLCWKQKIQSDVSKEFLETHDEVTQEDLKLIFSEIQKDWESTPLYRRVQQLIHSGKTIPEIAEDLLKEGIEI